MLLNFRLDTGKLLHLPLVLLSPVSTKHLLLLGLFLLTHHLQILFVIVFWELLFRLGGEDVAHLAGGIMVVMTGYHILF